MSIKATPEMKQLLKDTASKNHAVASEASEKIATAVTLPLRQGIQSGDTVMNIYERDDDVDGTGSTVEYPIHYMTPGTEGEYVAYTIPSFGKIPERHIEGDYVRIPTYDIGASIDWDMKYARNARWNVVTDALDNLRNQFVTKINNDGWHTILGAGYDRNVVVGDSDATAGDFSVRLVSLMKTIMRRNGGGNSTSNNRSLLSDLYISPEGFEDMRSWNVDQIDELTRREIFTAQDGTLNRIYNVNLHDLDELGEGQEYQDFISNTLQATLPTIGNAKLEWCVGLDLVSRNRAFMMPVQQDLEIVPDERRRRRVSGYFGDMTLGFGVLDSRAVLLGAF